MAYFQRSLPDARSSATRSPSPPPTYTTPSAIAADESIDLAGVVGPEQLERGGGRAAPRRRSAAGCRGTGATRSAGAVGRSSAAARPAAADQSSRRRAQERVRIAMRVRRNSAHFDREREELAAVVQEQRAVRRHDAWRRRRCPCSSRPAPSSPCRAAGRRRRRPRRRGRPCRRRRTAIPRRRRTRRASSTAGRSSRRGSGGSR